MDDELFNQLDRLQHGIRCVDSTNHGQPETRWLSQNMEIQDPFLDAFDRGVLSIPSHTYNRQGFARRYDSEHFAISPTPSSSAQYRSRLRQCQLESSLHDSHGSSTLRRSSPMPSPANFLENYYPTISTDRLVPQHEPYSAFEDPSKTHRQRLRNLYNGEQASLEREISHDFLELPAPATNTTATTSTPIIQGIRLVSIRSLPERLRSAFSFPLFNAVQSKCFETVYQTNDNFVLSAPTGSGKTGVLELAICRLLNTLPNDTFKLVYQAPTKSLCSERQRDWKAKFASLGLQCAELTGDTAHSQLQEVQHASIIITTPEKWDSITRKWKDRQKLMQMIKLFLIDEVHTLKEERGATLEAVVSRMKSVGSDVRFIAVSATIPNSDDIATWLGKDAAHSDTPAQMEKFGEEFRPVRLQKHVCGYQGSLNDFAFDKFLNAKLPDIIARWSQRKPMMIFCPTRKSCLETAKSLSKWWTERMPTERSWEPPRHQIKVNDKDLQGHISTGIAFHHAGMSAEDRTVVENSYRAGDINVICCTSTLATGVNLPCHMAIIKGTASYQGQAAGGLREYSDLEIMQMLGRAGRPQFDTSAVAVIITRLQRTAYYEKMLAGQDVVESSLHKNLIDHLNAEIGLGTVSDLHSAKTWLMGTFLYVRLQKNPSYYRMEGHSQHQSIDQQLDTFCTNAINLLEECKLVASGSSLTCTEFGDSMARYCIRFDTMKGFLNLPQKPKVSEVLSSLTKAVEFKEVRFRPGDKPVYRELNKSQSVKFPVSPSLDSPCQKVSLIIQSVLGAAELSTEDSKVKIDFQTCKMIIFNHVHRLIRCIVDCQLCLGDSFGVRNALMLARSLGAQVWDDSPLHLKQLEGIGLVGVRKLVNASITSIEQFQTAEAFEIERALSRNPPFGSQLQNKAASFPRLHVSLAFSGEPVVIRGESVSVQVKVNTGLLNEKTPQSFQRKAIYVCLLVDTSTGDVVHFGRISASKLGKGQEVFVKVNLVSAEQTIRAIVTCDDIAGTARQAAIKPNVPTSAFSPLVGKRRTTGQSRKNSSEPNTSKCRTSTGATTTIDPEHRPDDEFDINRIAEEDMVLLDVDEFVDIDEPRTVGRQQNRAQNDQMLQNSQSRTAAEHWEPRQLSNGKWACNHTCINKRTCKHRCCQEGVDKKPKAPKRKLGGNVGPQETSNQQRIDVKLTKKSTPIHSGKSRRLDSAASIGNGLHVTQKSPRDSAQAFRLPQVTRSKSAVTAPVTSGRERGNRSKFSELDTTDVSSLSDDDLLETGHDFIKDSSVLRSTIGTPENARNGDIGILPDEKMSGALPPPDSPQSIGDVDSDDLIITASCSLAPVDRHLSVNPRPYLHTGESGGITSNDSTQNSMIVSHVSDFTLPKDHSLTNLNKTSDKQYTIMSSDDSVLVDPRKRQKTTYMDNWPQNPDQSAGEISKLDKARVCIDYKKTADGERVEIDDEEWFKLHFGTEHFEYIG